MTSRGTKYWDSGAIPLIAPEILGDIISEVADLAIVISEEGIIKSVLANPRNTDFLKLAPWEGRDLRETLTVESVSKFDDRLDAYLQGAKNVRPVELNHFDKSGHFSFPVRYSFHQVGPDGAILLLGRDLQPIAEMQKQLVEAQLAVERDYEIQREYDARFRVLMEAVSDAIVFISAQTGEITDANAAAAQLLGKGRSSLIGAPLDESVTLGGGGTLVQTLMQQAMSERAQPVNVTLSHSGDKLQVRPTLFRAARERLLLCRIDTPSGTPTAADDLTHHLNQLYLEGPEAIVFATAEGTILSTNDEFLDLVGMAHDLNVRGSALSDYLQRGSIDMKVMTENATRNGRMRMYPTQMTSKYGSSRPVEVSVTRLQAGADVVFAFVIRDAARVEAARAVVAPVSEEKMKSVMDLVGSATLKEIVSETTNVIEKMCIETAVELTMNNRVAAAEMLGLSRQSLYVKLRKYGLLEKDPSA